MGFKEVQTLDADVCVALGKRDKKTGKMGPKNAEGYYLGSRSTENKRGESRLHFLQTPKGNLGVWGTTDLNRKLLQVTPGTMVRITSTGTKATPNGDMYTYKVEQDSKNTVEINIESSENYTSSAENASKAEYGNTDSDNAYDDMEAVGYDNQDTDNNNSVQEKELAAASARKAKVQALLNSKGTKSKN